MKAVLILAHKNMEQICRLASRFAHPAFHVFVHIDKKCSETLDGYLTESLRPYVTVCEKRVDAALDHFSLVEASLALMECAKEYEKTQNVHFRYYMLLSGQDYPIKSCEYMSAYLDQVYPKPLIDCTPIAPDNWVNAKFSRWRIPPVSHYFGTHGSRGGVKRLFRIGFSALEMGYTLFTGRPRDKIKNYPLVGGSAWWILPDLAADFILKECRENARGIKPMKYVFTPEEFVFQVLTLMSPAGDLVVQNDPAEREQNCMTYAFFTDSYELSNRNDPACKYPFTGHPYLIQEAHFDWIIRKPHFLVRKLDLKADEKIFDRIDSWVETHRFDRPVILEDYVYRY